MELWTLTNECMWAVNACERMKINGECVQAVTGWEFTIQCITVLLWMMWDTAPFKGISITWYTQQHQSHRNNPGGQCRCLACWWSYLVGQAPVHQALPQQALWWSRPYFRKMSSHCWRHAILGTLYLLLGNDRCTRVGLDVICKTRMFK